MSNPNTGGPAFPSPTGNELQNGQLTVRDYFAAKAMQAWLRNGAGYGSIDVPEVTKAAYVVADAMLKARQA